MNDGGGVEFKALEDGAEDDKVGVDDELEFVLG